MSILEKCKVSSYCILLSHFGIKYNDFRLSLTIACNDNGQRVHSFLISTLVIMDGILRLCYITDVLCILCNIIKTKDHFVVWVKSEFCISSQVTGSTGSTVGTLCLQLQ